jgi:hypothetical protein
MSIAFEIPTPGPSRPLRATGSLSVVVLAKATFWPAESQPLTPSSRGAQRPAGIGRDRHHHLTEPDAGDVTAVHVVLGDENRIGRADEPTAATLKRTPCRSRGGSPTTEAHLPVEHPIKVRVGAEHEP